MANPNRSNARCGANMALALLLSLALVITGCASAPLVPAGFSAGAARFEAGAVARPTVVVEGPASKVGGAFRGLAWGGGIGLLLGLAMESGCSFTCGVATAFGGLIGGGSGAISGAVTSEREADVDAKRDMLTAALAAPSRAQQLADALRAGAAPAGGPEVWVATVSLVGLETVGHGREQPWGLRLRARLDLRPSGAAEPAATLEFDAESVARRQTPDWQADGGRPLHESLDACMHSIAEQMLTTMRQRRAAA